ncbi:MAG TPA: S1 RNA-binding domain-containing protein [Polyangia bacterium]|nr:S1 RNA-binding domain-containing protein [Polyangia bacterium]
MTDRRDAGAPEEDFAAMLAAAEQAERAGGRGRRARLAIGDSVRGKVVSIGQEVTVVELAGGGEGTLETLELRDAQGQLTVAPGETLEARVVAFGDKQGFVSLRRGAALGRGRPALAEAAATGLPVEGVVTGVNKGGLDVDVGGVRGFCPLSQLELRPVADPAVYVGQRLPFRVTRYEEDRRGANLVLSRRALLEDEARARAAETRGKLVVGAVLPGVVTALKDFGAFVDVGGIEGLLPASEIGFSRGTRPADVLAVGQAVTVQVARIDKRDDPKRPLQISFSMKALERDPWTEVAATLRPGTVARGTVTRVEPFGAFVELAPGVEGLLHVSELGEKRPVRHAREAVKPGEAVTVTVLAVEEARRRISLALGERTDGIDDEGRAAAARASGSSGQLGTLGDLLKGKLPPR